MEKRQAKSDSDMVERDQAKGQKSPENKGMRNARKRSFFDDLTLAKHLPDKGSEPMPQRMKGKVFVSLRAPNAGNNNPKTSPKQKARREK